MLNLVNFKSQTPTMKFPRIKKLIQFDVDIWLYKNKLPTDQLIYTLKMYKLFLLCRDN